VNEHERILVPEHGVRGLRIALLNAALESGFTRPAPAR
jgi:hypothetical protein